jgi:hypothetical protein
MVFSSRLLLQSYGILILALSASTPAFAGPCNFLLHFFNQDLQGFSSQADLLKNYQKRLDAEYKRVYTPEETDYIRQREGMPADAKESAVGIQFRKEIKFARYGVGKSLGDYYDQFIPSDFKTQKSFESARAQIVAQFGDAVGTEQATIGLRSDLINFLSDDSVHFQPAKNWQVDEAVATDIFLMKFLQKRLWSETGSVQNILKAGGEAVRVARTEKIRTAILNHDYATLKEISGQKSWNDQAILESMQESLKYSDLWPLQRFENEIKIILAWQTQIATKNGWQLDFLPANPTKQNLDQGNNAFYPKNTSPACCGRNCTSVCPYNVGFKTEEKRNRAFEKFKMKFRSLAGPASLSFYQIKDELARYLNPGDLEGPALNSISVWWYQSRGRVDRRR